MSVFMKACCLKLMVASTSARRLRGLSDEFLSVLPNAASSTPSHLIGGDILDGEHEQVFETVVGAFNDRSKLPALIELFGGAPAYSASNSTNIEYCDPYPHCLNSRIDIEAHLNKISSNLADVHLTPMPQNSELQTKLWNKRSGSFWVLTMAYSIPSTPNAHVGHRGGLAQLTNAFFSWELSSDSTADKPIINSLRLNYDEQTWKKQLSQCQPDASDLMIYDPIPAGEVPLLTDKIHSLFSTVSSVSPYFDCPKGTPRGEDGLLKCDWVHAWTDIFDHTDTAALCEPAVPTDDHCRYGRKAIGETLPSEDLYATAFLPSSPIMVAGNVATVMTVWSSEAVDPSGCIESHVQVVQFELTHSQAKEDWGMLGKMRLFYGQDLENGLGLKTRPCAKQQKQNTNVN